MADGSIRTGKLDGQGRAVINGVPAGPARISFGPMPGTFERVDKTPMPNHDPAPSQQKIEALFAKYFKADETSSARGIEKGGEK
ncbi:Rhs element Vgr protein [Herbaspirillum sp. GW103]|nr:Rhs element Vgr protein [Herbaspirillum sp. GW103]